MRKTESERRAKSYNEKLNGYNFWQNPKDAIEANVGKNPSK